MIKFTIKDNKYPDKMRQAVDFTSVRMKTVVTGLAIKLVAKTLSKLDNNVLNRRTSTLFRSINHKQEFTPTKLMEIIGTNIKYGALHETGAVIPAHTRTSRKGKSFNVKSYKLPERSFLRSALKELAPEITSTIEREFKQSMSSYFSYKGAK